MGQSSRKNTENREKTESRFNRRDFLRTGTAAAALSTSVLSTSGSATAPESRDSSRVFFGDIHCHSDLSDGNGDPVDVFDVARSHLDFWALTDHAFDETVFSLDYRRFKRGRLVNAEWPLVQKLCREHESPGRFIPFLAFEWTNFQYGHHNVYYFDYDQPIRMPPTLPDLYAALENVDAMVIPHHTGYPLHICGKNWDFHNERLSPFVEVYSTHGSSETPEGVVQLLTLGSWMGPGAGEGCVQAGLARGYKLGIVASTDSHINHPGAYDLGLMAVHAPELSRKSLWEAFHKKRVYAVTGDRIELDFSINGHPMGSTVRTDGPRTIQISAVAWDQIDRIEILKNNEVFETFSRPGGSAAAPSGSDRFRLQVEWGWDARREHKWDATLSLEKGQILQAIPCFRGDMGDRKGTGVGEQRPKVCRWYSRTEKARYDNQARRYADLISFEIECPQNETLQLAVKCDDLYQELRMSPDSSAKGSKVQFMENIPRTNDGNYWRNMDFCAKFKVHQLRRKSDLTVDLKCEDKAPPTSSGGTDFYYVRVIQNNRQRAWSSPIWVESAV